MGVGGNPEGGTYVRVHRHRLCGLFRRVPLSFKWELGAFVVPDTLTHQYPPFCPGLSALPRLLRDRPARRCPPHLGASGAPAPSQAA